MALLAGGLLSRFYALNWPRAVVFDEFHFGKFTNGYLTGRYFFDIHPPLGKLLIATFAGYAGYDASQPFAAIGEPFRAGVDAYTLRVVPATFGAALVPLSFLVARELGLSRAAALLVGGLVLLDGALLVESRLLVTEPLLFCFELAQLYCALRAARPPPLSRPPAHGWLMLTGLSIGAAISTKWTALATMAVVGA